MPALALFDFDSTLTVRDMLPAFVRFATPPLRRWTRGPLLIPWVFGYRRGWVSGTDIRDRVARAGFHGMREADYLAAGARFAREVLPTVLRPEAMARLQWHRDRGDTIAVVSGSYDVYLAHWCRAHAVELLCSKLEVVDGVLTGRYDGAQCVGEEKARRVRERFDLGAYAAIHAYGDSHEDVAMLRLADEAWYRGRPWQAIEETAAVAHPSRVA